LIATETAMNPQVVYGEDIMSRIAYTTNQSGGLETIHQSIIEGLNRLIETITQKSNLRAEDILEVTMVGNTVMHHLLLKMNPESLRPLLIGRKVLMTCRFWGGLFLYRITEREVSRYGYPGPGLTGFFSPVRACGDRLRTAGSGQGLTKRARRIDQRRIGALALCHQDRQKCKPDLEKA
jgi:hypothetical protein